MADQQSSVAYALATESVHGWLRLLLFYHVPSLVQHLDRVLPRWELPTKTLSASEVSDASDRQTADTKQR